MKNMEFGQLLNKLLYISNQKKNTLAKELGYDTSYISKWINGKNLPTQKTIFNICITTSQLIVKSLNQTSKQELKRYFEIEMEVKDDEQLIQFIDRILNESYISSAQKNNSCISKNTQSEENYNSRIDINPRLTKKYLTKDFDSYISESDNLDIILSTNIHKLKSTDKISLSKMKASLSKLQKENNIKMRLLTGFDSSQDNLVENTLLIINMIGTYNNVDFEIYNCNIEDSNVVCVIKDRLFHSTMFSNAGRCLFTNTTKEKHVVDDAYYTLEEIVVDEGKILADKKTMTEVFKEKSYIQYILGENLKWVMGSMTEFFMPEDLFYELSLHAFGYDEEILRDLCQINTLLQNITYKSEIKILIYESELMKYISNLEVNFFNKKIKLSFEQMEKHMKNLENIIENHKNIDFKFIKDDILEDYNIQMNPSVYLSNDIKFIKANNPKDESKYAVIKDVDFKKSCEALFDVCWENKSGKFTDDKVEILEKISKILNYARVMNQKV